MGSIVLGALGSGLLGPVGGMIGGQAGSMLDNMLLNHKYIRKPSLQDLIVEASTMGLPIPIVYGRNKLAGNLIQSDLLHAEKHSGKGGMMGGSKGTPYYTYNASFACGICRGPIRNIWRIFADSKVIWDMNPDFANQGTPQAHPFVMSSFISNGDGSGGTAILYHYGTGKNSNRQTAGSSVRFYYGVEGLQGPDPAMQAIPSMVGFAQPAYQGMAYAVFNGLPLADFGNRIPNLSFEVNGFYTGPTNIRTEPTPPFSEGQEGRVFYDIVQGVIYAINQEFISVFDANTMALIYDKDLTQDPQILAAVSPSVRSLEFLDNNAFPMNNAMLGPDGTFWVAYACASLGGSGTGIIVNFDPQLGVMGAFPVAANVATSLPIVSTQGIVYNLSKLGQTSVLMLGPGPSIFCGTQGIMFLMDSDGCRFQAYNMNFIGNNALIAFGDIGQAPYTSPIASMAWSESRATMVGVSGGMVAFTFDISAGLTPPLWKISDPIPLPFINDGNPYSVLYDPGNDVFVFTSNTNMYSVRDITTFTPIAHLNIATAFGGAQNMSPDCFSIQQLPNGTVALIVSGAATAHATPIILDGIQIGWTPGPGPGATSGDGSGGAIGGGSWYIMNTTTLQEDGTGVHTDGVTWNGFASFGVGPAVVYNPWGNGCIDYNADPGPFWAQYKPNGYPITLATIVQDICLECGLTLAQIDTSALAQTIVFGYMISQEASGRAALEPLQEMYQFDMVEIDGVLTAKMRAVEAANVLISIAEADLGARAATAEIGANPQPKVIETRKQDIELPQYVFLRYRTAQHDFYVKDFSFAIATQYAKRAISPLSTVYGMAHQSLSSTIVLSDQAAANIAIQILILQYLNRNEVQFSLPIKYIALTPGDVVNLTWHDTEGNIVSYPVYVRQADLGADNTIKVEGVSTNGSVYQVSSVPGSTIQGKKPFNQGQPTTVFPLETPPLRDADDNLGFYWGACGRGSVSGSWGCSLVTSIDGGQSFGLVGNDIFPAALGITQSVLGTAPSPDTENMPVPGVWDPINTVILAQIGGPIMAGVSPEQVLDHQNIFLIGQEIIGASNVVLNSDGTYTLSLLQRGLLGTDIFMGTHAAGERWALLASDGSILSDNMNTSALNQTYLYAGISVGSDITNSKIFNYAVQGTRIRPEAACHLGIVRDISNNATITWNPRMRINYEWIDGAEPVTDESTEAYNVDILSAGGNVVRTFTTFTRVLGNIGNAINVDTGQRSVSYSAAQQASDGLIGAGEAWNPADLFNMSLSGADLIALNPGAGNAAVRATTSATAGLFYWEFEPTFLSNNGTSVGVADVTYSLSTQSPSSNFKGVNALTGLATLQVAGFAYNLNTNLYWTRQNPGANWNGSPTANPATGAGGISMGALSGLAVFPCFVSFSASERGIANFGGSPFVGVVPAGYALGWPGPLPPRIEATIYEISSRIGRGFPATIIS